MKNEPLTIAYSEDILRRLAAAKRELQRAGLYLAAPRYKGERRILARLTAKGVTTR